MEAWKFVKPAGLSPLFALGFTTKRWGLEPFPGNVVAISGYWKDIKDFNLTVESDGTLPYSCSDSEPSSYYNTNDQNYDGLINISPATSVCPKPQACPYSNCTILIEGIGRTITGPANSKIVGLSHGISFFLVCLITAAIMGCILSKQSSYEDQPSASRPIPLNSTHNPRGTAPEKGGGYGERAVKQRYYAEQTATAANRAKQVARCSDLLRQMYELDLNIWALGDVIADDVPKREEMKYKANALFAEIRRTIQNLRAESDVYWPQEERQQIEEIWGVIAKYGTRRY